MHDPLEWRLYDTCGVHHVSTRRGHEIFMLVEKDYPLTKGLTTLLLCNKLQVDQAPCAIKGVLRSKFGNNRILIEPVEPMKKKDLIRLDKEVALKLQAEFDEEERLAREKAEKEKKPILP
ncbi:hypothetical protein Tco_1528576 [Tanacetum coccineum]